MRLNYTITECPLECLFAAFAHLFGLFSLLDVSLIWCFLPFVGLESVVKVNINVQDVNDNEPELRADDIYICENDESNTVRGDSFYTYTIYRF